MPDISAILKNKGISLADTNESKILSSLNGLFQRPVEPIHFSKLVSNKNQFYREEELEELADTILLLGGIAQNLLVRKIGVDRYEILVGHRRWRASKILVEERGYQKFAFLPCLAIECDDVTAEVILILTNSTARGDANGYEQMMEVVRLQELIPKMKGNEDLKGRVLRKEIALSVKKSESTVQNMMYIFRHLSAVGMAAFKAEKLTPASALYLARQSPEDQEKLVNMELLTVPAMDGYLAAQRKRETAPELSPVSVPETPAQPYVKECTTGLSLTGSCEAAARCESPYDCCISCRKDCPNRCGWITETMPEKLPDPAGKTEKTPAPVKKTSDPAIPGRAAAAHVPEKPEPQLSDNRSSQEEGIRFINAEHHRFYSGTLKRFPDPAAPEKALCYCLGIHPAIREHVEYIYDFSTGQVTPECMQEEWVTSTEDPEDIRTVIRMAYNLYGGTPSVTESDDQLGECQKYTAKELFGCRYAPYFWEAVKIRYPEYTE
jgi:ParB/RepB/Spo0J family partition protein